MCKGEELCLLVWLTWSGHRVCASFQYGDYDPNVHKRGFLAQEELLPKRVRRSAEQRSRCPSLGVFGVTEPCAERVSGGLPEGCTLLCCPWASLPRQTVQKDVWREENSVSDIF